MAELTDAALAALFEAVPVAVVVVDGGKIVGWNEAAEVLYGYPAAEVVGSPVTDVLFDPDDAPQAAALFESAGAGEAWAGDCRVRRRDGVLLVSAFRAVPVGAGDNGAVVAWVAADRMDQGLAEQERAVLLSAEHAARATAEEALGLVEAVVGSAPVGIAVVDLDLRYVRVNAALAALTGIPEEDHIGGYVGEVVPLPPEVVADLRRVVTTGRTIIGRDVQMDLDGGTRYFNVSYYPVRTSVGPLVGAGATVVEVTEAKRAEQERAELLARTEAAQKRLAILATATTALTTTMEVDDLLGRLARTLAPSTADWCVIELVAGDGTVEHVAAATRDRRRAAALGAALPGTRIDPGGDDPVARVLRSGQGELCPAGPVPGPLAALHPDHGRHRAPRPDGSWVVAPIRAREQTFGVLILATEGAELTDDDLDLAVEVAHRAGLALGNARSFQREHEFAANLQQALLPATLPRVPGVEVAVRYLAGTAGALVGGDWYDVIAFDEDRAALVVGDVVGHDIEAASAMGQLRTAVRAYAHDEHGNPAAVLARLDRLIDQLGAAMATCLVVMVDTHRRTLTWSNAGHPPPLLLRAGQATYLNGCAGTMLGIGAPAAPEEASADLQPGDALVLFTDGLVERRGESLDEGLERLARVAARIDTTDPDRLGQRIVDELLPSKEARSDDVALVVARIG